jgi:hypothetical protein
MLGSNLADLVTFIGIVRVHGHGKTILLTRNSICFTSWGLQSDHEIWAFDGAGVPFILHKTRPKTYRIGGECYLWAALELHYCNSGTKKGPWSENRPAHNAQLTHVIEIH